MKFKRILSLLLTVLLVFSSIPMMALSAETTPSRMLHFKPFTGYNVDGVTGDSQLGQLVNVTPGSTYQFSFGIATNVEISEIAFKALNNGSRSDAGITYELISFEDCNTYWWLTYSITVPEDANSEIMFGISLPGGSESYIFDMKFYDPSTSEKANMYLNTTLETLDEFAYGAYLFWIPNYCWPEKGGTINDEKTVWTYDYEGNTGVVEVMDYDAKILESFSAPSRMLHFKPFTGANVDGVTGDSQLGQLVNVTPGSTYQFSFGIATNVEISEIAFKALNNGSRSDAGITYELISSEDCNTYWWLTYSITVPEDANSEIMFGISLPGGSESYIFDMKLYDPSTSEKANMFSNTTLETLNEFAYGAYLFWIPNYCWAEKGGTINDEKTVWTYDYEGNTGVVEVMDYDAKILESFSAPSRMLHFKPFTGANVDGVTGDAQLGQLVNVTPGSTYHFSFGITTNVDISEIAFKALNNGSRSDAGITYELISSKDCNTYWWLTYSITVPEDANSEIMFGISLPGGSNSYIFNMNLYDPSTPEKVNMFSNTTLETLDEFAYGAYLFWIPNYCWAEKGGTINDEKTVWTYDYEGNTGVVEVMDYDAEILDNFNNPQIAEPDAPSRMLHFKPFTGYNSDGATGDSQLGQLVNVTPGNTYYFSFGITTNVDISEIALKALNNGSRSDAGIAYELISSEDRDTYLWLTYSVTVPEDANNELMFGISLPGGSNSYIFNMNLYDPSTSEKANMFSNTTLETLDEFIYGAYIFWIPNYGIDEKGGVLNESKTAWNYTNDSNTGVVEVMDYDAKILESFNNPQIAEPDAPSRMLHFKPFTGYNSDGATGDSQLGQLVNVTPGNTYYFSFGITTNVGISEIALKALNNGSRSDAGIAYELISSEDRITYSWLTYSVTVPEDANDELMFGISLPGGSNSYIFNMNFYDPSTTEKANMFSNTTLETLDEFIYGAYIFWIPNYGMDEKGGVLNESKTAWNYTNDSNTGVVEVMDYDAAVLDSFGAPSRMLHFKPFTGSNSDGVTGDSQLGQLVNVTPGSTYQFSFGISTNVDISEIALKALNNGSRSDAGITYELISTEERNTYSRLTYSVTVPEDANNELMFGISLPGGSESYIFDMKFYDPSTSEKANMFSNTSLETLDEFVYGAYLFWIPNYCWPEKGGTINDEKTVWTYDYNGNTGVVEVMDYDAKILDNFINPIMGKTMIHIKEYKERGFDMFVQQINGLETDVEYTVSYKYHMVTGSLDVNSTLNSMVFGIYAGNNDPKSGTQVVNNYLVSDHLTLGTKSKFTTTTDDGVTYTHTFTLKAEDVENSDKFYAGFYTLPDPKIVTEFYIAELVLYRSDDETKTNLLMSGETETKVDNWYSLWGPSVNNELFTRPNIEYTAKYVPCDDSLFTTPDAGIHYGDSNADGVLDIRDLVNLKKRLAEAEVAIYAPADLDNNDVVDSADVVALRKHFVGVEVIEEWSDYTYNIQAAANLSGGADADAAELKASIADYEDSVEGGATGTIYYVAADGKADNDGTNEEAPISIDAVNDLILEAGDAVLFKRGDTFRISEAIDLEAGVGYGTYGTGDKPQILGSLRDYADASIWTADATGDIWSVELGTEDASNIVFNNDTLVGVRKATFEELKVDGDFYYDADAGKLYLFLSQVNPGKYFDTIEIATTRILLQDLSGNNSFNYSEDITVENLSLKYATVLGMDFNYSRGFYIAGCEVGWIGGAYFGEEGMRYGNGIQFWREAEDCTVESNYIYQIFDAAITFQGTDTNEYTELYFETNLIEYCSMNFEFWGNSDDTVMSGIYFTGNILRFGGYGFGGLQRPGYTYQGYILAGHHSYADEQINDFTISGNIFDIANCNYVQATGMMDQLSFTGNTYYQNADSYFPIVFGGQYAKDADSLATAIKGTTDAPGYETDALVNWVE